MAQCRVARGVAMQVVDLLHVVDVEIDDARGHAIALRERDHPAQLADEGTAVGDRGQRVLVGKPLERGDAAVRLGEFVLQPVTFRGETKHRLARLRVERGIGQIGKLGRLAGGATLGSASVDTEIARFEPTLRHARSLPR